MSLKKVVQTRTETYTIYSSEMQERMKVYFDLTEEYSSCMSKCPKIDEQSDQQCEKVCGSIYDKYALLLKSRYEENPEKLKEVVSGARSFDKVRRTHTNSWFYKVFGFNLDGSHIAPPDEQVYTPKNPTK